MTECFQQGHLTTFVILVSISAIHILVIDLDTLIFFLKDCIMLLFQTQMIKMKININDRLFLKFSVTHSQEK